MAETESTMRLLWPRRMLAVAMGTGTDVAMENAGVTLVKGICGASSGVSVTSKTTMRNSHQNLFFAFVP